MQKIEDLSINESRIELHNGKYGKLVVFMYCGSSDPRGYLNIAVSEYVGNQDYIELIDSQLDNPWTRVVIIGVNDMQQMKWNDYIKTEERKRKLERICNGEDDKLYKIAYKNYYNNSDELYPVNCYEGFVQDVIDKKEYAYSYYKPLLREDKLTRICK